MFHLKQMINVIQGAIELTAHGSWICQLFSINWFRLH